MSGLSPEELVAKYAENRDPAHQEVLAGLEAVDWHSIQAAYGEADDVPALLYAALSSDEADRSFAFQLLYETIRHQGSVYEASTYVVPFLFQMLKSSITPDRDRVACLLAALAHGHPETNEEPKYKWVNATCEAVGAKLDLLYPFLESPDEEVRALVAIGLSYYPARAHEIRPLLAKALELGSDKSTAAAINAALEKLARR